MIARLSEMCGSLAPALADHLWQSTMFAVAVGLLTMSLRRNNARARYGLWFAASLKFLLPLSVLVTLGSHIGRINTSRSARVDLYVVTDQVSQPFTRLATPAVVDNESSTTSHRVERSLPVLVGVWLAGFLLVLSTWYVRWRSVSRSIGQSVAVYEGREIQALRRMERVAGVDKPIELRLTSAFLEPGIFGVFRPVLLWPQGISEHLDDSHVEAIAVHEVWHVRRRDNLAAAIHMLVTAIFWFHPLVWWLGARLVEARERACDEHVLASGSAPRIYAESILKTCEFCTSSSLACVSGVTGAHLTQRIVHIMSQQAVHRLDFGRRLLLTAAGFVAISVPLLLGMMKVEPAVTKLKSVALGRDAHPSAEPERATAEVAKAMVIVEPRLSPAKPGKCTRSSRRSNSPSLKVASETSP